MIRVCSEYYCDHCGVKIERCGVTTISCALLEGNVKHLCSKCMDEYKGLLRQWRDRRQMTDDECNKEEIAFLYAYDWGDKQNENG